MTLSAATNTRLLAYTLYGIAATCFLVASCSSENGNSSPGGTGGNHIVPDATVGNEACASDPLRTELVVEQTGISADAYDCEILKYAAQFNEPDPMIFKAIIYVESRFDYTAVGCPNACGTPAGWSPEECGCCGLMQSIAPACSWDKDVVNFLPNGHPNMEKDPAAPNWPGSVFNPDVNIEAGIQIAADNRVRMAQAFPNCTEAQYTLMSIGEFNSYGSTKSCTSYNSEYTSAVLEAYHTYAAAAGYTERVYP
jgi:hypothetical protein